MSFMQEARLDWWQAAEILATVPWDGRRCDPSRLAGLEEAMAKFVVNEIRSNVSREFRYHGIRFCMTNTKKEGKNSILVRYEGHTGDVKRGEIAFLLTRDAQRAFHVTLTATQDKMDRFFREKDEAIFESIVESFSEYVGSHF